MRKGEKMSDLISRQAAINKLNERQRKLIYCFGFENDAVKIMDIAKSIIATLPSVQPECKTGEWIYDGDGYKCNKCGTVYGWWADSQTSNFCPNCGADMRGEQNARTENN
jgi:rubrerythrin